jgi:hypothetical protein
VGRESGSLRFSRRSELAISLEGNCSTCNSAKGTGFAAGERGRGAIGLSPEMISDTRRAVPSGSVRMIRPFLL